MPFTPPPDDYIQHSKLREVKTVNFEYIYDPKKNHPLGVIDSMTLSAVKRNLDNDLTEAILKRVGLSNIDDFVYALTDIKIKNKSLSKPIEFKLGQQSRYTGKNNDPNLFIADEDAYADLKTMCKDTKGYVILHTNKSSVVCDGRYENTFKIDEEMFIPKSNVLGAGDMFASSFLYGIHLGLPIDQIQKYAHETTSKLIRIENEKV